MWKWFHGIFIVWEQNEIINQDLVEVSGRQATAKWNLCYIKTLCTFLEGFYLIVVRMLGQTLRWTVNKESKDRLRLDLLYSFSLHSHEVLISQP